MNWWSPAGLVGEGALLADGSGETADRMFHSTIAYGRKGVVLHAISGVDLAIWDLHGKLTGSPVYALLGGPLHESIEMYATGPSPGNIAALGFWGAKLPLTWGPSEGEEGFRHNVERAARAREAVGPEFRLLYDCWMTLDVDYAVRLAWALEHRSASAESRTAAARRLHRPRRPPEPDAPDDDPEHR